MRIISPVCSLFLFLPHSISLLSFLRFFRERPSWQSATEWVLVVVRVAVMWAEWSGQHCVGFV